MNLWELIINIFYKQTNDIFKMVNRTAEVYAEMMAGQASEASVNMEEEEEVASVAVGGTPPLTGGYNTIIATTMLGALLKKKFRANGWYFTEFPLPIKKIDNVKCLCEIILSSKIDNPKRFRLSFVISIGPPDLYNDAQEIFEKNLSVKLFKDLCLVQNWLVLNLESVKKLIQNLRVHPQKNSLTEHFEKENTLWKAQQGFCEGMGEHIETHFNECCVCADITTMYTRCKHSICIVCLSNLHKQKCPMCRNHIYADDDEEDDDDDEDDDEEEEEEEGASSSDDHENSEAEFNEYLERQDN